jgi:hypothetical protein
MGGGGCHVFENTYTLGDLAGAKTYYERALKIFRQFLPEGHPNIKIVEDNLRMLEE